jgi:hypothetical protein
MQLSLDGRYVVFKSTASDLVAGDTNDSADIFRVDLLYKANAAAIAEGRYIETTLAVGNASSASIAWGDGTGSAVAAVAGRAALHHAYASTGAKDATATLVEGALTWNVAHIIDVGTMVRNTALADTLTGGAGNDMLTGDALSNILNGAGGNDRLDGGAGVDIELRQGGRGALREDEGRHLRLSEHRQRQDGRGRDQAQGRSRTAEELVRAVRRPHSRPALQGYPRARRGEDNLSVLMLAAPDDAHGRDRHGSGAQQVHGRDDHLGQTFRGDCVALNVEEEVLRLHVAAIGEVDAGVELHAVRGGGIGPIGLCRGIRMKCPRQAHQRRDPQKRWMRLQASSRAALDVA